MRLFNSTHRDTTTGGMDSRRPGVYSELRQESTSIRDSRIPRKPIPRASVNDGTELIATSYWQSSSDPFVERKPTEQLHVASPNTKRRPRLSSITLRLRHIFLVYLFILLPLAAITMALLIVVYDNRLPRTEDLTCGGLVINYGASQLTSLSTWISTIASLLTPAFMALFSYPVARAMTGDTMKQSMKELPSPYQTGMLVELLSGSLLPLWTSMTHMLSRHRPKISPLVHLCYAGLFGGVLFAILTQLADFWLHQATQSILYSLSQPLPTADYGRQLSTKCQDFYANNGASRITCTGQLFDSEGLNLPCTVVCGEYDLYPANSTEGYLIANSLPASSTIQTVDTFDGRSLVALFPSNVNINTTWKANTIAAETKCESLFDKCDFSRLPEQEGIAFRCGPEVPPVAYNASGAVPFNVSLQMAGYNLHTLLSNEAARETPEVIQNPWTFGVGMQLDYVGSSENIPENDNLYFGGNIIFALVMCNTTTYDIEYSTHITSSIATNPITVNKIDRSSLDIQNTVQGHILHATDNAMQYVERAMQTAIFSAQNASAVLPRFEEEYSKVALGFAAPAFDSMETIERSTNEQIVVSCVEKSPLWSLVGLVGIYIALATVLLIIAIRASDNEEFRSAQSQLSITGLAARAFNEKPQQRGHQHHKDSNVELLFEETRGRYRTEADNLRGLDERRVRFRWNETSGWQYALAEEKDFRT
jgi:hypothetical protein